MPYLFSCLIELFAGMGHNPAKRALPPSHMSANKPKERKEMGHPASAVDCTVLKSDEPRSRMCRLPFGHVVGRPPGQRNLGYPLCCPSRRGKLSTERASSSSRLILDHALGVHRQCLTMSGSLKSDAALRLSAEQASIRRDISTFLSPRSIGVMHVSLRQRFLSHKAETSVCSCSELVPASKQSSRIHYKRDNVVNPRSFEEFRILGACHIVL